LILGVVIDSDGSVLTEQFNISNVSGYAALRPEVVWNAESEEWLVFYSTQNTSLTSTNDVHYRRVRGDGSLVGVAHELGGVVSNASARQLVPMADVSDDGDEYFVVWSDNRSANYDIYGDVLPYGKGEYSVVGNDTVIVGNNSGVGVLVDGVYDLNLSDFTVSNFTYALLFNTGGNGSLVSNGSVVTNMTLENSSYGVLLNGSVSNVFYYNNFSNNVLHAVSTLEGNMFNVTNGSSCGSWCARGNWWDDVPSMLIFDVNGDGFGDSGPEYPYNSTYREQHSGGF
jgi:hypothetical protein